MARRKKRSEHRDNARVKNWFIKLDSVPYKPRPANHQLDNNGYFANNWDQDPVFGYHREFMQNHYVTRSTDKWNKNRMANVMPWLLTMSLLGVRDFATPASPNLQISQELEAPLIHHETSTHPGFREEGPPNHANCNYPKSHDELLNPMLLQKQNGYIHPNSSPFRHPELGRKKTGRNLDSSNIGSNSVQPFTSSNEQNIGIQESEKIYNPHHTYRPPVDVGYKNEYAGPAMNLRYAWKTVDFEFGSDDVRNREIVKGTYVPENNLPLGLEVWKDKVFLTLPRWKKGISATLATVPRNSHTMSPKLTPYPNWDWHHLGNCDGLTSVFRVQVDECDRLWVLDSGKVDVTSDSPLQLCPPAIFIFDLRTDQLIRKFTFPENQIKQDSLYTNIIVDVRNGDCQGARAYASDVWRFGLVTYDFYKDSSFRIQHHYFFPDPLSSRYELHGLQFQWTDGLFGIALSPVDINGEKTLFFHPMSSFREFAVPVSALKDERTAGENIEKFVPVGKPRAKDYGHSSGSAIDSNGVMFFNMVTRDSVWCWDTRKEYIPQNLGVIGTSNVSLVFPNDVRIDHEDNQSVWVLSNKLPMYIYGNLDKNEVNFRIFQADVHEAVKNTVCDPNYMVPELDQGFDDTC